MRKSNASRPGRRRIAGERTVNRPSPQRVRPADRSGQVEAAIIGRPETPDAAPPVSDEARSRQARRGPSNLLLAGLAVLAAAVVAAAAYFAVPAWHARAVQQAQNSAPSVAERAAKAILSYDYRSLGHDEKAAAGYLTPSYRKKYENTFSSIRQKAPGLKAVVTAAVLGSGISEADADHAHVLLFVDQTTNSLANARPQVALNRVMLDMVRRGGAWLVNGITAY